MRQSKTQRRARPSAPAPSNVSEGGFVTLAISSNGAAAGAKDTKAPGDQLDPALMSSLTKAAAASAPARDTYAVSDTAAGRHKARSAAEQQLSADSSDASVTIRNRMADSAPPRPAAPRPSSRILALPNGDLVLLPRHMACATTTTSATTSAMHSGAGRSFPAGHTPWREPRGNSVPAAVWLAEEEAYTDESVRSAGLALSPRPTPRALRAGHQPAHPCNGEDKGMARAEGAGLAGYSLQPPQHAAPVSLRPRSAARGVYTADRTVLPPVSREEDGGIGRIGGVGGVGGIEGIEGIKGIKGNGGIDGIGGSGGGSGIGGIEGNEGRQSPTAPQVQRLLLLPSLHADRQGEDQAEAGRAGYTGPPGSTEAAPVSAAMAVLVPALSSSRMLLLVEEEAAGSTLTDTEGLGDPLGDPRVQHHLETGHRHDVYAVGTTPGQQSIGQLEQRQQQQQQQGEIQAAEAAVSDGGRGVAINGGAAAGNGAPEPARPQSVWRQMWRAVRPRCLGPDKRLVEV